ncbi:dihydrolipoyl dehydrogenase [Gottschalkiaceae bacterium SANA]|nr:dihydrolipoyl dehydrogenase [Gottschalkiaceae bacterium SANA]
MAAEIIMPKAGMAMDEGTIVRWYKEIGDPIEQGEAVLEILTDKVNMDVEAEASGVLLVQLAKEGDVLPVFTVIGFIGAEGEEVSAAQAAVSAAPAVSKKDQAEPEANQEAVASDAYDVVVLGGGPAGYVAAIKAAQLGGKVALVEKIRVGGTCLNRGCIPTKTYVKNAEILEHAKHAASRGILFNDASFELDMEKIVGYKDQVVNTLTSGVAGLLTSYGVDQYNELGLITADKKVRLASGQELETKKIIWAGGSKVAQIPIPGIDHERVLTSDTILDLKEVPESLVVIGGGVIGCEMAEIFNAYGTKVTIVELADELLPMMELEISQALRTQFTKKGITILTGRKVEKFEGQADKVTVTIDGGDTIIGERALVSIGRVPDLSGLGELDLEMNRERVVVDDKMETSVKGIYAPGDINGRHMLAHAAFKMGEVAAANAMGHAELVDLSIVPSAVYLLPEIGSVGLTEAEAKKKYGEVLVGKFPFSGNGRALASGETVGMIKVIVEPKYFELIGTHIYGPAAAEMINEAAALMAAEVPADIIADTIHGHPTYSEAFMEACADALKRCIHLPKKA